MSDRLELLETTREYLLNFNKCLLQVSEELRGGKEKKGLEMIPDITQGLEWIVVVIKDIKCIDVSNSDLEKLNSILREIVEALETQDNILVGDLFEYELIPIINNIENRINNIITN
ncbi:MULTISPECIES: hypothetical protein [Clostridium]|uniref:hypothetical protein n=1 Tax=Clostridium TaxID=1485 RepID=UPI0008A241C5|nr:MULTISPECIES: hypothetical protein [Clostridium]OFS19733.1 hypothetical protein HMPREF3070_18555 [Clostridium sp. HMSC19A10]